MISTLTNLTLSGFGQHLTDRVLVFLSVMSIQFLLGFSVNCYIIFLLLSRGRRVDISVVFTLNQSAAEIIFSILAPLNALIMYRLNFAVLLTFLNGTSICARLLFPCCVCLERYLAVVHPVTFLRLKPLRYRVACSILVWLGSLILGINIVMKEPFKVMSGVFFMILTVEFFCCVSILRKLRDPGPRDMRREQGEMNAAKKKAFQTVFINLLIGLAQKIPLAVSYLTTYRQICDDPGTVHLICAAVNIFAGFVQPFIILHKVGKLSFVKCF